MKNAGAIAAAVGPAIAPALSESVVSAARPAAPTTPEDRTRDRLARTLLEDGPATAASLAQRLGVTPAAVRRHLDAMVAQGAVAGREAAAGVARGRGRPAKVFALTDAGRAPFAQAYDDLASHALRYLAATVGEQAVTDFARARVADLERRYAPVVGATDPADRPRVLAEALRADGYAASARAVGASGAQLCQHHCPVAHVAAEFPQLCEAETEVFARLLGTHVQRLATIAHGDGVCTTHVPERAGAGSTETASRQTASPKTASLKTASPETGTTGNSERTA